VFVPPRRAAAVSAALSVYIDTVNEVAPEEGFTTIEPMLVVPDAASTAAAFKPLLTIVAEPPDEIYPPVPTANLTEFVPAVVVVNRESAPVDRIVAVCVVPAEVVPPISPQVKRPSERPRPLDAGAVPTPSRTAAPVVEGTVAMFKLPYAGVAFTVVEPCVDAALAEVTDTRERTPAPSATTVASATRFVTVFVDMYFLSISRSSLS
jgi:hypothetical protein